MKMEIVASVATMVALSTILLPSTVMGKAYVVGDEKGWSGGVDYQAWAANKVFWVDDVLGFNYEQGKDHVYEVDGPSFQNCTIPASGGLSSGFDVVFLTSPGRRWFIGDHCNLGQKLAINVHRFTIPIPPAPSPSPSPSTRDTITNKPFTFFLP